MASIYDLKPRFQACLRPICRHLANAGVTANQVTVGAVLLSVAAGGWIAMMPTSPWPYLILPAILFIRMALNAIDGMLAREFDMKSRLGAVLNEMGDVISDVALYLPFALHPDVPAWAITILVLLAVIVEMMGVVAVQIGVERRYDGPFGKSDRAFAFGLLALVIGMGVALQGWIQWLLIAAIALSVFTVVNRARNALADGSSDV